MRIIKKVGFGRQMPWYVGGGYGVAVCGCNTVAGNKKTAAEIQRSALYKCVFTIWGKAGGIFQPGQDAFSEGHFGFKSLRPYFGGGCGCVNVSGNQGRQGKSGYVANKSVVRCQQDC